MRTKSIVLLSTAWGPRYGGINAFNMDLCCALADLISPAYEVVCMVLEATRNEIEDAGRHKVKLVSLEPRENRADRYDRAWAYEVWEKLRQGDGPPQVEWWIGHDVISGEAANRLIHLAALAALRGESPEGARELLAATLKRERDYWRRALSNEDLAEDSLLEGFEQIIALITLVGGTKSAHDACELIISAPRLRDRLALKDKLFDLLRRLYPLEGGIDALRPDLLGARQVAQAIQHDERIVDIVLAKGAPDNGARGALTVLTRLAKRHPEDSCYLRRALERHVQYQAVHALEVAMETGDPLGRILAEILEKAKRNIWLGPVSGLRPLIPKETVALSELAVTVADLHLKYLQQKKNSKSRQAQIELCEAYLQFAVRLSNAGQPERALQPAQKAVQLSEILARSRNAENRTNWARSLNNLAKFLSDLGHFEKALQRAQQAEILHRELAAQQPDAFRSDWALSLNNLANHLSNLGHFEEALEHAQQAETLHRELAAQRPDAFRPDWAASLSTLANCLFYLGHFEEALQRAQQAETLYHELAAQRPDAFRFGWAKALENFANHLSNLGHFEKALERAQQAETLYRELTTQRPDAFRPDWARSSYNIASILEEGRQPVEALAPAKQAADLFASLAEQYPAAYEADYAQSLAKSAEILLANGRIEEALRQGEIAEHVLVPLFAKRPAIIGPTLAEALDVLARCQSAAGQVQAARMTARRAVEVLAPLFRERPRALYKKMEKRAATLRRLAEPGVDPLPTDIAQTLQQIKASVGCVPRTIQGL